MKCTFYRPKTAGLTEWDEIIAKMRSDLEEMEHSKIDTKELEAYAEALLAQAEPLEKNPAMRFFGFDKPETMPSDARVDYFYWPTYIATVLVMNAVLRHPSILRSSENEEILRSCMLGCTGRGFKGHGFDDIRGLVEVMEFFTAHNVGEFLAKFGVCPEFEEQYEKALSFLKEGVLKGSVSGSWGDDYTERAYNLLVDAGKLPYGLTVQHDYHGKRLYLAYGSNLDRGQMQVRCPDAKVVGTAELKDWRLMFKGSKTGNYLTIEKARGYKVPVVVWEVSEQDEANLDRYEGCPTFYYKKELPVTMTVGNGEAGEAYLVTAFVYIMHEDRKLGCPRGDYLVRCLEGYLDFGFDEKILIEAYKYSRKGSLRTLGTVLV